MASLYKPKIVTYRLKDGSYRTSDGKRVTKDTPGRVKGTTTSKKWYGRYTDANGQSIRVPLSDNKEIARRMLAKLAGDAQLQGVGIDVASTEQLARPIAEHVEDFRRYLGSKGNTADHVARTCNRVLAVCEACGFQSVGDLEETKVLDCLAGLRNLLIRAELDPAKQWYTKLELVGLLGVNPGSVWRMLRRHNLRATDKGKKRRYPRETVQQLVDRLGRGASITTCNHYLTAIKGFARWLVRNRRLKADPLAHLQRQNPDTDRRRERRAIQEDAFQRFVETTGTGREISGLSGPDRLVLYTLAANTGFRAGELASLTPASFSIERAPFTVTVRAGYSKRRREDVQPLRPDVADMMRQYLDGKPMHQPIWGKTWKRSAADTIRHDLAAVGIPYEENGRYFDFHALRGQFISLLAAGGVHPKVAQVLARHSTITLTMDYYTHVDLLDVHGALDKLPATVGKGNVPTGKPRAQKRPDAGKARTRRKPGSIKIA